MHRYFMRSIGVAYTVLSQILLLREKYHPRMIVRYRAHGIDHEGEARQVSLSFLPRLGVFLTAKILKRRSHT
jgi:hypothetical protein